MNKPIKITGEDIIGWDATDPTGALKELGVPFDPNSAVSYRRVYAMTFHVDLDFIIRHILLNSSIYDSHYKGSPGYVEIFNEGAAAFLAGKPEEPPYDDDACIYLRQYPWYDGYRETQKQAMEAKYSLSEMRKEIRAVIEMHGLTVEDCDEYPGSYSYGKTPEGYHVKLT